MRKDEIDIIPVGGSLSRATNIISITDRILKKRSKGIVLNNPLLFLKQKELENLIISYIIKNFYYYIGKIILGCAEHIFEKNEIDVSFYDVLINNDKKYEYPRAFYRQHGRGVESPDKEYDNKVIEKCEEFILCSPPIDIEFDGQLFDQINCKIAGTILVYFDQTSISKLLGYKIRYYGI